MDPENGSQPTPDNQEPVETQDTNTETVVQENAEPQNTETPQEPQEPAKGDTVADALAAFDRAKIAPELDIPKQAAAQVPAQESRSRSYEGLNEQETRIFKRMSNEAYNFLYPQYLETRKLREDYTKSQEDLKKLQGASYVDHEDAYKLTTEYSNITGALDRITQEGEYWKSQLEAVEAGGQFQDLSYDEKTGKYSTSAPIDASPRARAYLIDKITQSHTLRSQIQAELGNFQVKFKTDHTNYLSGLKETREKVLKNIKPELRKSLEKAASSKLELWPLGMRQRPEVMLAAELLVINEGLTHMLTEKDSQLTGKRIVNNTTKSAGPANLVGASPVSGNTVGSVLDQFKKAGYGH